MNRLMVKFGVLFLVVLFSGCATAMRGSSQEVKFEAEERPFVCMLPNGEYVSPPIAIKLSRRKPHRIVCVRRITEPEPRAEYSITHFEIEMDWGGRWQKYLFVDGLLGGFVLPFVDYFIGGPNVISPASVSKYEWRAMPQNQMIKGSY